jgi:hypothetical protein
MITPFRTIRFLAQGSGEVSLNTLSGQGLFAAKFSTYTFNQHSLLTNHALTCKTSHVVKVAERNRPLTREISDVYVADADAREKCCASVSTKNVCLSSSRCMHICMSMDCDNFGGSGNGFN